jgi:transcriptional regulator of arginine metabolism
MKSKRQMKIIEIIEKNDIDTQEELISRLKEAGYDVTQATVSRDIRELKLVKTSSENGNYKYKLPREDRKDASLLYNSAFTTSIKSIRYSGNNIVIHTYPGLANAVAAGIDAIDNDNILGCVAGDDTIIAVVSDPQITKDICEHINQIIKG